MKIIKDHQIYSEIYDLIENAKNKQVNKKNIKNGSSLKKQLVISN